MTFSYRYYARRNPATGAPFTYLGEIDGPNVSPIGPRRTMTGARLSAWWRNRRRGFNTCGATRFRRVQS